MRFSVYQISRKGGREKNEDRMGYCYTRDAGLFALADGMGGHPEGEVASQLARRDISDAVPELVEQALRNGGAKCDNVSLLAVEWEGAEDGDRTSAISTQSLGEAVFASTIQAATLGNEPPDELDDAEIERSIKEINEAIKRSSQHKKS